MKLFKFLTAIVLMASAAVFTSCGDDSDDDKVLTDPIQCHYNLYTEVVNFYQSDFDAFTPLWELNADGDYVTRIIIIEGASEKECNAEAIKQFDAILSKIDDAKACAGLHGEDYMKAILQPFTNFDSSLKTKIWTSQGATVE
ncbi:MAG: hypothetical protein KBT20_05145 [Bacteroidales bacterium]|nr:hypothetical protein [Candidatus Liminaster caballi]